MIASIKKKKIQSYPKSQGYILGGLVFSILVLPYGEALWMSRVEASYHRKMPKQKVKKSGFMF